MNLWRLQPSDFRLRSCYLSCLEHAGICRPRLLLEEEFKGAEIAAVKLGQLFPDTDVSMLAEKAPLLLVEEVDDIVSDLRR